MQIDLDTLLDISFAFSEGASRAYKIAWLVCCGGGKCELRKKSQNQTKVGSSRKSTYKALCYSLSWSSWTLRIKTMQVQLYIVNYIKVDVESLCNIESWHFLQESMHFSSKVSISGSRTKQPATTMMMVCISWSPAAGTPHVSERPTDWKCFLWVWNHWQLLWSLCRQGISKV